MLVCAVAMIYVYVSWHTIIRDIGKSSHKLIITNSERQIITENTFIIIKKLL